MENKDKILWAVVGLLVVGFVWLVIWGNKTTVVVNDKGQVVGAVSGPDLPNPSCIGGLCTKVMSGDFVNSTTTFISIPMSDISPATSVVSLLRLNNTGVATSSYEFTCGPAKSGAGVPDIAWLRVVRVATNTQWGTIFDNATSTTGWIGSSGLASTAGGVNLATTTSLVLNPKDFFICNAAGINGEAPLGNDGGWDNAFRNVQNTFDGNFQLEVKYSTHN